MSQARDIRVDGFLFMLTSGRTAWLGSGCRLMHGASLCIPDTSFRPRPYWPQTEIRTVRSKFSAWDFLQGRTEALHLVCRPLPVRSRIDPHRGTRADCSETLKFERKVPTDRLDPW